MIKKQQRRIALITACAFLFLLQSSSLPMQAKNAPDRTGTTMESSEPAPAFIEEELAVNHQSYKRSFAPVILISAGIVAVAAILILVVLKSDYNIVGTWLITVSYDNDDYQFDSITVFKGDKKSGTLSDNHDGSGTYSVENKNVTFSLLWPNNNSSTFSGQFTSKNRMNGTFSEKSGWTGTWVAINNYSAASLPNIKTRSSSKGPGR
jgi:hypothetical protein